MNESSFTYHKAHEDLLGNWKATGDSSRVKYQILAHQSISVHAFTFVQPKVDQLLPLHEILRVGLEQAFEHVREVSYVEFVVKVCRCFAEIGANLGNRARVVEV